MAAVGEGTCHSDPNFAVICSFLDKYGQFLGLPEISFADLQSYLEDTKVVSKTLIDLHVRLLKRIGRTNVNHERFERSITKFCFYFSDHDGWEVERFGYRHAQLATKLRVLKNLLECQFDYNIKFKEKINEFPPEDMRFLPAGRDRDGMTYWYLVDKELNVYVYREEPDDENAESWKLLCSDRDQLAHLLERLRNNTQRNFLQDDKDDKNSIFTDESSKSASKEASPEREVKPPDLAAAASRLETAGGVKHEPPGDRLLLTIKTERDVEAAAGAAIVKAEPFRDEEEDKSLQVNPDAKKGKKKKSGSKKVTASAGSKAPAEPLADKDEKEPLADKDEKEPLADKDEKEPLAGKDEKKPLADKNEEEPLGTKEEVTVGSAAQTQAEQGKSDAVPFNDGTEMSEDVQSSQPKDSVDRETTLGSASKEKSENNLLSEQRSGSSQLDSQLAVSSQMLIKGTDDLQGNTLESADATQNKTLLPHTVEGIRSLGTELEKHKDDVKDREKTESIFDSGSGAKEALENSMSKSEITPSDSEEKGADLEAKEYLTHSAADAKVSLPVAKQNEDLSHCHINRELIQTDTTEVTDVQVNEDARRNVTEIIEMKSETQRKLSDTEEETKVIVSEMELKVNRPETSTNVTVSEEEKKETDSEPQKNVTGSDEVGKVSGSVVLEEVTGIEAQANDSERREKVTNSEVQEKLTDCMTQEKVTVTESRVSGSGEVLGSELLEKVSGSGEVLGSELQEKVSGSGEVLGSELQERVSEILGSEAKETVNVVKAQANVPISEIQQQVAIPNIQENVSSCEIQEEGTGSFMQETLTFSATQEQGAYSETQEKLTGSLKQADVTHSDAKEMVTCGACVEENVPPSDTAEAVTDISEVILTQAASGTDTVEMSHLKSTHLQLDIDTKLAGKKTLPRDLLSGTEEGNPAVSSEGKSAGDFQAGDSSSSKPEPSAAEKSRNGTNEKVKLGDEDGSSRTLEAKSNRPLTDVDRSESETTSNISDKAVVCSEVKLDEEENTSRVRLREGIQNKISVETEITARSDTAEQDEAITKTDTVHPVEQQCKEVPAVSVKEQEEEQCKETPAIAGTEHAMEQEEAMDTRTPAGTKRSKLALPTKEDDSKLKGKVSDRASAEEAEEPMETTPTPSTREKASNKADSADKMKVLVEKNPASKRKGKKSDKVESGVGAESLEAIPKATASRKGKRSDNIDLEDKHDVIPVKKGKKSVRETKPECTEDSVSTIGTTQKKGKKANKSEVNETMSKNNQAENEETEMLLKKDKVSQKSETHTPASGEKDKQEELVNGHSEDGAIKSKEEKESTKKPTIAPRRGRGGANSLGGLRINKRGAQQMESEDAVTEPAEKRAKRGAVRGTAARRGRGRRLPQPSSDSDSDIPLACTRGGRGRKPANRGGLSKKAGAKKKMSEDEGNADSCSTDDLPLSRNIKKKKTAREDGSNVEVKQPLTVKNQASGAAKGKKTAPAVMKEEDPEADFLPTTRRSLRILTMKKKDPDPEFELGLVDDGMESGELSPEVDLSLEEDSEDDDFRPTLGRNRRRQAALKTKEEAKVPVDDTPCLICDKSTHPDMILLCDNCDKGYHMACLRPPLMVVPEGDWFCPPCEHGRLIEKLADYLKELDTNCKKKDRLVKRKERLAFVGISLDNILKEEKAPDCGARKEPTSCGNEKDDDEEEDDSATEIEDNGEYLRCRPSSRGRGGRRMQQGNGRHRQRDRRRREDSASPLQEQVYAKRTCRTRGAVSYQFKEYDELINSAIEEDLRDPKPPRPRVKRSGKDMSNILGMDSDEEKELRRKQKEEEDLAATEGDRPPPVVKKKNRRRLTLLDSDDDNQDDFEDESEEFQLSESDEDSEASGDQSGDESFSEDSGDWAPQRTWYNKKGRGRYSRYDDDFVVEDDGDSDEGSKRRSTRNSTKRRVRYRDWESETEESLTEESEASLSELSSDDSYVVKKKKMKKVAVGSGGRGSKKSGGAKKPKPKKKWESEESSDSEFRVKVSKSKKRSQEKESEEEPPQVEPKTGSKRRAAKIAAKKVKPKKEKEYSDDDTEPDSEITEDDEEEIFPTKKKNVFLDSDSGDETEKKKTGKPKSFAKALVKRATTATDATAKGVAKMVTNIDTEVKTAAKAAIPGATANLYGEDEDTEVEEEKEEVAAPKEDLAVQTATLPEPEKTLVVEPVKKAKVTKGKGKTKKTKILEGEKAEADGSLMGKKQMSISSAVPAAAAPVTAPVSVPPPTSQGFIPNFLNVERPIEPLVEQKAPARASDSPPPTGISQFSGPHPSSDMGYQQHPQYRGSLDPRFPHAPFNHFPTPSNMGYNRPPEGYAPFPHGPYPVPGENVPGQAHAAGGFQQANAGNFYRPRAMIPYGGPGGEGFRPFGPQSEQYQHSFSQAEKFQHHAMTGQVEGFRPQVSVQDGLRPVGPQGFQSPGQEGFRQHGPGHDSFRHRGPSQEIFRPHGPGQESFRPQGPSQEGFRPQGPGQDNFRPQGPGQEKFRPQGPGQESFRPQGPGQESFRPQMSGQEGFRPQGPGKDTFRSQGSGQESFRMQGPGQEGLRPTGPGQESFRPPGPGQENFRPKGPGQESFRPPGPGQEGFRPQGPGQESFRPPGPGQESFRPQGPGQEGFRPQGLGQESFRPPGPGQESFRPQGPGQEGFRPPGPGQENFRPQAPGQEGFRPQGPGQEGFRPQGPGQENFRFQGPSQEGFRTQDPGQEGFKAKVPGLEGIRPHHDGFSQGALKSPGPLHENFRPQGASQEGLRPPVSSQDGHRPHEPGHEGFGPSRPQVGVVQPAPSQEGVKRSDTGKRGNRTKGHGAEGYRTQGPGQEGYRPQGIGQEGFQQGQESFKPAGQVQEGFSPSAGFRSSVQGQEGYHFGGPGFHGHMHSGLRPQFMGQYPGQEGFRTPTSEEFRSSGHGFQTTSEGFHYPVAMPHYQQAGFAHSGQSSFMSRIHMQNFRQQGQSQEGLRPQGPGQESIRPTGTGQENCRPATPGYDGFKPPGTGPESVRPPGLIQDSFRPKTPGQEGFKPQGLSNEGFQPQPQGPGQEGLRPAVPRGTSQEGFRHQGPGQEGSMPQRAGPEAVRPQGPDQESYRPQGPVKEGIRTQGPSQDVFRPHGPGKEVVKPQRSSQESCTPQGPSKEVYRPQGSSQEGIRPKGSQEGIRPHGPGQEVFRPQGPGQESFRSHASSHMRMMHQGKSQEGQKVSDPGKEGFRPAGPGQEHFGPPGAEQFRSQGAWSPMHAPGMHYPFVHPGQGEAMRHGVPPQAHMGFVHGYNVGMGLPPGFYPPAYGQPQQAQAPMASHISDSFRPRGPTGQPSAEGLRATGPSVPGKVQAFEPQKPLDGPEVPKPSPLVEDKPKKKRKKRKKVEGSSEVPVPLSLHHGTDSALKVSSDSKGLLLTSATAHEDSALRKECPPGRSHREPGTSDKDEITAMLKEKPLCIDLSFSSQKDDKETEAIIKSSKSEERKSKDTLMVDDRPGKSADHLSSLETTHQHTHAEDKPGTSADHETAIHQQVHAEYKPVTSADRLSSTETTHQQAHAEYKPGTSADRLSSTETTHQQAHADDKPCTSAECLSSSKTTTHQQALAEYKPGTSADCLSSTETTHQQAHADDKPGTSAECLSSIETTTHQQAHAEDKPGTSADHLSSSETMHQKDDADDKLPESEMQLPAENKLHVKHDSSLAVDVAVCATAHVAAGPVRSEEEVEAVSAKLSSDSKTSETCQQEKLVGLPHAGSEEKSQEEVESKMQAAVPPLKDETLHLPSDNLTQDAPPPSETAAVAEDGEQTKAGSVLTTQESFPFETEPKSQMPLVVLKDSEKNLDETGPVIEKSLDKLVETETEAKSLKISELKAQKIESQMTEDKIEKNMEAKSVQRETSLPQAETSNETGGLSVNPSVEKASLEPCEDASSYPAGVDLSVRKGTAEALNKTLTEVKEESKLVEFQKDPVEAVHPEVRNDPETIPKSQSESKPQSEICEKTNASGCSVKPVQLQGNDPLHSSCENLDDLNKSRCRTEAALDKGLTEKKKETGKEIVTSREPEPQKPVAENAQGRQSKQTTDKHKNPQLFEPESFAGHERFHPTSAGEEGYTLPQGFGAPGAHGAPGFGGPGAASEGFSHAGPYSGYVPAHMGPFHPHSGGDGPRMGPEGFPPYAGFYPHQGIPHHPSQPFPPFQGPHYPYPHPPSSSHHYGGEMLSPQSFSMYPPQHFSSEQSRYGHTMNPVPHGYHLGHMPPPAAHNPHGSASGPRGFMIDNLLAGKAGETPPPRSTPPHPQAAPSPLSSSSTPTPPLPVAHPTHSVHEPARMHLLEERKVKTNEETRETVDDGGRGRLESGSLLNNGRRDDQQHAS